MLFEPLPQCKADGPASERRIAEILALALYGVMHVNNFWLGFLSRPHFKED